MFRDVTSATAVPGDSRMSIEHIRRDDRTRLTMTEITYAAVPRTARTEVWNPLPSPYLSPQPPNPTPTNTPKQITQSKPPLTSGKKGQRDSSFSFSFTALVNRCKTMYTQEPPMPSGRFGLVLTQRWSARAQDTPPPPCQATLRHHPSTHPFNVSTHSSPSLKGSQVLQDLEASRSHPQNPRLGTRRRA